MNILLLGPPGHGKALLEIRITESSQVTRVIYHKKLQKTKRALSFIGLSQNWKRANICLFDAPGIVLGCDMVDKMLNGVREGNSGWIFRSVQWQTIFLPDDVNKLIRVKTGC